MKNIIEKLLCMCFHDWVATRETLTYRSLSNQERKEYIPTWVRKCSKCDKKQYRTQLPRCNGYDQNKWRDIG